MRAAFRSISETFRCDVDRTTIASKKKARPQDCGLASCKTLASHRFWPQRSRRAAAARPKYIVTSSVHCYSTYAFGSNDLAGASARYTKLPAPAKKSTAPTHIRRLRKRTMSRQGPLGAAHSQSDRYRRRLSAAGSRTIYSSAISTRPWPSRAAPREPRRQPRRSARSAATSRSATSSTSGGAASASWRLQAFNTSRTRAPTLQAVCNRLRRRGRLRGRRHRRAHVTPGTHDTEGSEVLFSSGLGGRRRGPGVRARAERYFNVRDERDAYRDLQRMHLSSAQGARRRPRAFIR